MCSALDRERERGKRAQQNCSAMCACIVFKQQEPLSVVGWYYMYSAPFNFATANFRRFEFDASIICVSFRPQPTNGNISTCCASPEIAYYTALTIQPTERASEVLGGPKKGRVLGFNKLIMQNPSSSSLSRPGLGG